MSNDPSAIEHLLQIYTDVDRIKFVAAATHSAAVAVLRVDLHFNDGLYIAHRNQDGITLSDGSVFDHTGLSRRTPYCAQIMMQPERESVREFLARKLSKRLANFPWRALTAEQLDACVKYAEAKLDRAKQLNEQEAA